MDIHIQIAKTTMRVFHTDRDKVNMSLQNGIPFISFGT